MQITCKECGARVPADDVNLDRMMAKCRACDAVFAFADQLGGDALVAGARPALARRRPPVPLPDGLTVIDEPALEATGPESFRTAPALPGVGRLVIKRRWFTPILFFMLFFCVAWDGFLVMWYSIATRASGPFGLLFLLFPLIHVAIGVSLTYTTIAGFFNSTTITLTGDALTIHHGPLPWRGNRVIPVGEIEQLFVEEQKSAAKKSLPNATQTSGTTYALSAVLRGGRKVQLVKSLPEAAQAFYIEQRVEERLGIEDAEVGGEYRG